MSNLSCCFAALLEKQRLYMEIFAQGIRIVYMKQKHELVTTIRCEASELVPFLLGGGEGRWNA